MARKAAKKSKGTDWQKLFQEFWEENHYSISIRNPNRFYQNVYEHLADVKDVGDISFYVAGLGTGQETVRRIMVRFFEYLEKEKSSLGNPR